MRDRMGRMMDCIVDVVHRIAGRRVWSPRVGQRVRVRLDSTCRKPVPATSRLARYTGRTWGHADIEDGRVGTVVDEPQAPTPEGHPYWVLFEPAIDLGDGWPTNTSLGTYALSELEPADA